MLAAKVLVGHSMLLCMAEHEDSKACLTESVMAEHKDHLSFHESAMCDDREDLQICFSVA